ncbi:Cytosol non-specific dipeptidase [Clostridiales bacterium CHKCI001]|nr:Cytosol non-specific dipeptidase [Clostridiales bacterium CHKCI001]
MREICKDLKPEYVFRYFEDICRIPHGSGDTKAISDYCVHIAKRSGLDYIQDSWNNVIIRKPATLGYESAPVVMLQGHLDMVNEKLSTSNHDFSSDPLELTVEGEWLHANGTTLGGDDGIAVAYMLAILTDPDLQHPALECVFTVDEETGLIGATEIDLSECRAKYLINLDSEEEGVFLVSCAGGVRADLTLPIQRKSATGEVAEIILDHLTGGHSGNEIHKERANADQLMGRMLFDVLQMQDEMAFSLIECEGGTKDNAIPRTCSVKLVSWLPKEDLEEKFHYCFEIYKKEYQFTEKEMGLTITWKGQEEVSILSTQSQVKVLFLLRMIPNGVCHWSKAIKHLVETSLNLGIMKTDFDSITLGFSIRSSVETRKQELMEQLKFLVEFLGGSVSFTGNYPGWEYNPDSVLCALMTGVWEEMYGAKPEIKAIHAGLECGIISQKIPGIDIVSMGPQMEDIHTPEERLNIVSVEKCYNYIIHVLEKMK